MSGVPGEISPTAAKSEKINSFLTRGGAVESRTVAIAKRNCDEVCFLRRAFSRKIIFYAKRRRGNGERNIFPPLFCSLWKAPRSKFLAPASEIDIYGKGEGKKCVGNRLLPSDSFLRERRYRRQAFRPA